MEAGILNWFLNEIEMTRKMMLYDILLVFVFFCFFDAEERKTWQPLKDLKTINGNFSFGRSSIFLGFYKKQWIGRHIEEMNNWNKIDDWKKDK